MSDFEKLEHLHGGCEFCFEILGGDSLTSGRFQYLGLDGWNAGEKDCPVTLGVSTMSL